MTDRIIGCPHEEGIDYEDAHLSAFVRFGRDATAGLASAYTNNWRGRLPGARLPLGLLLITDFISNKSYENVCNGRGERS